jgi:membrane-associated protein
MTYLLDAFHWSQLLQPQYYIENGGLWLLLFVVFAETGLFFGFFLPGDSLLFVAGIYSDTLISHFFETFHINIGHNQWVDLFILFAFICYQH